MSGDGTGQMPSPSTSIEDSSDRTLDEWMDQFISAANEGLPKVIERRRRELEAYYDEVARTTGLPRAQPPED
jgi:hypothetical protein